MNQKLSDKDVRQIRRLSARTTKKELAFKFKVSYPTITRIIRKTRRKTA